MSLLKDIPKPNARVMQTVANTRVHEHACVIYRDQSESAITAAAFIKAGLEQNDQCVYVGADDSGSSVIESLTQLGVDAQSAMASGQLSTATKQESYVRNGVFDPDKTVTFFAQASQQAQANGYRAIRGVAEMSWQLAGDPGSERLLEYESKINQHLFPKHQAVGLCQFSADEFSASVLREVLYTHPLVIIGGLVCKNFYYKPPDEYLMSDHDEAAEKEVTRMLHNIFAFEQNELELIKNKQQLHDANRDLEKKVAIRTAELEQRNAELRQLNINMVGREYRIRELEAENQQLKARLAQLIDQATKGYEGRLTG